MNEYRKWYRFASDTNETIPFLTYAPAGSKWAPLGVNSIYNGAGWWQIQAAVTPANGCVAQSNDFALSLDNIPLGNPGPDPTPPLYGQVCRQSSTIFIKRIFGHFRVKGNPDIGDQTQTNLLPLVPAKWMHCIERTPINSLAESSPTSQAYQAGAVAMVGYGDYPIPFQTTAPSPADTSAGAFNFLCFGNATAALPNPILNNGATAWTSTDTDHNSCYALDIHRSPACITELYDFHTGEHHYETVSPAGTLVEAPAATYYMYPSNGLSSVSAAVTTMFNSSLAPKHFLRTHKIEHSFPGEGMKVVYADTAGSVERSVATINQLRFKYWQDRALSHFVTNDGITYSARRHAYGNEQISYEIFVEFEDSKDN